jgi:hypothetical protein
VTLPDFLTGLSLELRLRAVPFDRGELEAFANDMLPLVEEEPDPIRSAEAVPRGADRQR